MNSVDSLPSRTEPCVHPFCTPAAWVLDPLKMKQHLAICLLLLSPYYSLYYAYPCLDATLTLPSWSEASSPGSLISEGHLRFCSRGSQWELLSHRCCALSHSLPSVRAHARQRLALAGCQAGSLLWRCFHIKAAVHQPQAISSKPLALTHTVPCSQQSHDWLHSVDLTWPLIMRLRPVSGFKLWLSFLVIFGISFFTLPTSVICQATMVPKTL